jgi:hypothetical protein
MENWVLFALVLAVYVALTRTALFDFIVPPPKQPLPVVLSADAPLVLYEQTGNRGGKIFVAANTETKIMDAGADGILNVYYSSLAHYPGYELRFRSSQATKDVIANPNNKIITDLDAYLKSDTQLQDKQTFGYTPGNMTNVTFTVMAVKRGQGN